MELADVVRLLAIAGVGYGAWAAYKSQVSVKHQGRRYYRQRDGGYATAWRRRVRDPALIAALNATFDETRRASERSSS